MHQGLSVCVLECYIQNHQKKRVIGASLKNFDVIGVSLKTCVIDVSLLR